MHEQPTSCSTFNVMSFCKVHSFRRRKIVLCEESSNGVVHYYVTSEFLSGSTLSTTCVFLASLSSHGIKWSTRFPKKNVRTLSKGLQYLGAHLHNVIFCIQFNAFKIVLYNVLSFLNLAMDLYYIHNLHTYTKYRMKMVRKRYKRGWSLGISRSITIYFHNWKHLSIG